MANLRLNYSGQVFQDGRWVSNGVYGVDMDKVHLGNFVGLDIGTAAPDSLTIASGANLLWVTGQNFAYDANEQLTGGAITGIEYHWNNQILVFTNISVPASTGYSWVVTDNNQAALTTVLSGDDIIQGSTGDDVIRGFGGNDKLFAEYGSDTIYGGAGEDTIRAGDVVTDIFGVHFVHSYLRGDEGNDLIQGRPGFDDINGNTGADTEFGDGGGDWVVGGQGDDLLYGDDLSPSAIPPYEGKDIVYGNLGNDTCYGGPDNDWVRGGQGNDVLYGDDGDDWMSGDRGNDTETGGSGADTFYFFKGAGIDRILDFKLSEHDKVQLDAGQTYQVSQVGADTVIDLGGGDQMILVGVTQSSLTSGWIVVG